MPKELILYCDESSSREKHFSDFYGGVLISSDHIDEVRQVLAARKAELNFLGEVKWQKITENYEQKYKDLIDTFFDLIEAGKIKVRIMFTQNMYEATGLTKEHVDNKYFVLYYQFIKHAFGLKYAGNEDAGTNLRVYLDKMPDTAAKVDEFRNYLCIMTKGAEYRNSGIHVVPENVTEVNSHEHDALQCLDIVLGSINFRLNDKHLEIPVGKKRRGKRTRAKERVYKHINARIRGIYPRFNIGASTGIGNDPANSWNHEYRHWLFIPKNRRIVSGSKRKKAP